MTRRLYSLVAVVTLIAGWAGPAHAASITTIFASDNGQSGNMFDVDVFGNDLLVTSLDLNLDSGTWDLALYTKAGTYVGSETTAGDWNLVDTVSSVTSAGIDLATSVNFADFLLPNSATTAFYVTVTNGTGMNYTNPSGDVAGDVAAVNADLQVLWGVGKAYPFGGTFSPRLWNGTIHYDVAPVPEPATLLLLGTGLLGVGVRRYRRK